MGYEACTRVITLKKKKWSLHKSEFLRFLLLLKDNGVMTMNSQKGTRVWGNKNKNKKIGPRNHRQVMKKENITYKSPPMVDWNHYQALEKNF